MKLIIKFGKFYSKFVCCSEQSFEFKTVKIIATFSKLLLCERTSHWLQHRKGLCVCVCVCVCVCNIERVSESVRESV